MDGDDQSTESSGGFIDLITDLASSRPDGISEDEREELVENAIDLLSEDAENRKALVNIGGAWIQRKEKKYRPYGLEHGIMILSNSISCSKMLTVASFLFASFAQASNVLENLPTRE